MLEAFKSKGIKVEEIEIPQLNETHVAHLVTIATEMLATMQDHFKTFRQPFSLDTLLNLTLAKEFTGTDYIKAQRLRSQLIRNLNEIFKNVDAIVSPSTSITAPPILPDALVEGESDLKTMTELMRFAPEANIGGFPAISLPSMQIEPELKGKSPITALSNVVLPTPFLPIRQVQVPGKTFRFTSQRV